MYKKYFNHMKQNVKKNMITDYLGIGEKGAPREKKKVGKCMVYVPNPE